MKSIKYILITFSLVFLFGCPAYHYYSYKYVGKSEQIQTKLDIDVTQIKCQFVYQYIENKNQILLVEFNKDIEKDILQITSKNNGILEPIDSSLYKNYTNDSVCIFGKTFNNNTKNQISKLLKNDTITIEFKNGIKYYFAKD